MHPHKIMHDPVAIQSFLEASCVFGIPIGLPPIGRTPASQRRMEGFQMIGMNLCGGDRLYSVGMLWIRGLILGAFATALMPLSWLQVFQRGNATRLPHGVGQERETTRLQSEKYVARCGSKYDEMRMIIAS